MGVSSSSKEDTTSPIAYSVALITVPSWLSLAGRLLMAPSNSFPGLVFSRLPSENSALHFLG